MTDESSMAMYAMKSRDELLVEIRRLHQQLAESEAVTVERCIALIESLLGLDPGADAGLGFENFLGRVRALSPDPNFLARKLLEARLEQHRQDCHTCHILQMGLKPGCFVRWPKRCETAAELTRQRVAMEEGK